MTLDVCEYLAHVMAVSSPAIERGMSDLDAQRGLLARSLEGRAAAATAALGYLARKRLLASNTLMKADLRERRAWDDANRWIAAAIERCPEPAAAIGELPTLNAILTGGDGAGAVRAERLYSCGLEYLSPDEIGAELVALEAYVREASRPPLLVAAAVYIGVVTIHPFENGNGRTARLAADRLLLQSGYLPLCFLSPVASHVAQMQGGPVRHAAGSLHLVLEAVAESYTTVLRRLSAPAES